MFVCQSDPSLSFISNKNNVWIFLKLLLPAQLNLIKVGIQKKISLMFIFFQATNMVVADAQKLEILKSIIRIFLKYVGGRFEPLPLVDLQVTN